MSFDLGFDFRASSGFVTDPAYGVAVLGEAYPTTYTNSNGDSINAGWDDLGSGVQNLTNTNDPRIAGNNWHNNSGVSHFFLVDLSSGSAPGSGTYAIDLAIGDSVTTRIADFQLKDNTVVLIDGTNGGSGFTTGANHYIDATLADVNATTSWTGATASKIFATTTVKLFVSLDNTGNATMMAHFRLTLAGGTSTDITPDTGSLSLVGYQPTLTGQMTITAVFSNLGDQGFIAFQAQQILLVEASLDGVMYKDITALGRAVTGAILFSHVAFFFYRVTSIGAIVYTTGADKATIN